MPKFQDLTGQKFNKLIAIKFIKTKTNGVSMWLFKCDCSKEKVLSGAIVKLGKTKSCGCIKKETHYKQTDIALSRPKGKAGADILWCNIRFSAKDRGIEFNLTRDDVFNICSKNCYYCNEIPYKKSIINNRKWGKESTKEHGAFLYNSLDRVDNTKGYELNNVVPCCKNCNVAKHTMTLKEFENWTIRLYDNFIKNRLLNDKEFVQKELKKCKRWLTNT